MATLKTVSGCLCTVAEQLGLGLLVCWSIRWVHHVALPGKYVINGWPHATLGCAMALVGKIGKFSRNGMGLNGESARWRARACSFQGR